MDKKGFQRLPEVMRAVLGLCSQDFEDFVEWYSGGKARAPALVTLLALAQALALAVATLLNQET